MPKKQNLNVEVYLEDVRCSHPHLFEPTQYKNDKNSKPRYTCGFILDKKKNRKLIEEIEDAIEDVKDATWPDGAPRIKEDNLCFRDGNDLDKDEYQGAMLLKSARAEKSGPPEVLDRDKRPLTERSGKPYGGCYVNAIVRIYSIKANDQINCSLEAVQYYRKGEAFGRGAVDTSKFETFEEEDGGEYESMRGSRGRDRDEDRGSRRRSRDDDDDDRDPPRRSRSRDEDGDRDPPRRSRARDDDDDDRDPPRRSRSRDEDDERPARRRSRDD
jgi:hypothetical protein